MSEVCNFPCDSQKMSMDKKLSQGEELKLRYHANASPKVNAQKELTLPVSLIKPISAEATIAS